LDLAFRAKPWQSAAGRGLALDNLPELCSDKINYDIRRALMKKSYGLALAVFLVLISSFNSSCKKENPELKAADAAYLAGDYQKAITSYQAYLSGTPAEDKIAAVKNKISESYYNLGEQAFNARNWQEAITNYSQSENTNAAAGISQCYFNMGEEAMAKNDYQAAIDAYTKSTEPGAADKLKAAQDALAAGSTAEPAAGTGTGGGTGGTGGTTGGGKEENFFLIKVASFPAQGGAQLMVNQLLSKGFRAYQVVSQTKQHTVFVGKFPSRDKAQVALAQIHALGKGYKKAYIVKRETD